MAIPAAPDGAPPPPDTVIGAFVRNVEARIAELEKAGAEPGSKADAAAQSAAPGSDSTAAQSADAAAAPEEPPAARTPAASSGQDPAEELADLREVLRLGRHLLEGRQVTL
jgi:hypothetical protein